MKIIRTSVALRQDEVAALDRLSHTFEGTDHNNRSAAIRQCLRDGMEANGIKIDYLKEDDD